MKRTKSFGEDNVLLLPFLAPLFRHFIEKFLLGAIRLQLQSPNRIDRTEHAEGPQQLEFRRCKPCPTQSDLVDCERDRRFLANP